MNEDDEPLQFSKTVEPQMLKLDSNFDNLLADCGIEIEDEANLLDNIGSKGKSSKSEHKKRQAFKKAKRSSLYVDNDGLA